MRRRTKALIRGSASIDRRQFLRLGAMGAGAAIVLALPASAHHSPTLPQRVTIYRLSTHSQRSCRACRAHAANHYFQTREAADGHRSHLACNCAIVTQAVPRGIATAYFRSGPVFDRRTDGGPQKK